MKLDLRRVQAASFGARSAAYEKSGMDGFITELKSENAVFCDILQSLSEQEDSICVERADILRSLRDDYQHRLQAVVKFLGTEKHQTETQTNILNRMRAEKHELEEKYHSLMLGMVASIRVFSSTIRSIKHQFSQNEIVWRFVANSSQTKRQNGNEKSWSKD